MSKSIKMFYWVFFHLCKVLQNIITSIIQINTLSLYFLVMSLIIVDDKSVLEEVWFHVLSKMSSFDQDLSDRVLT